MRRSKRSILFDHFVGAAEQRQWNRDAECLGGLEIDEEFDLGGLLHRQVGRFLAFENAAGVDADQTQRFRKAPALAHQAAGRGEVAILIDRWNPAAYCQCGELTAAAVEEWVGADKKRAGV